MKVKIMQRSVYHKYAEVMIEIPDGMECNDIHEYLTDNDSLYTDKMDKAMSEAEYHYGSGVDDYRGMVGELDTGELAASEWSFEYGGSAVMGGPL